MHTAAGENTLKLAGRLGRKRPKLNQFGGFVRPIRLIDRAGLAGATQGEQESKEERMFRKTAYLAAASCLLVLALGAQAQAAGGVSQKSQLVTKPKPVASPSIKPKPQLPGPQLQSPKQAPGADAEGWDPNQICRDNGWAPGIYNDAGQVGSFDLVPSSTHVGEAIGFDGGANICGANATWQQQRFYTEASISYYAGHGRLRCARWATDGKLPAVCGSDGAMPDGSYIGSAQVDTYCMNTVTCMYLQYPGVPLVGQPAYTYNRYDTSGPGTDYAGVDANRCVEPDGPAVLVTCAQTESTLNGQINCGGDIITTWQPSGGRGRLRGRLPRPRVKKRVKSRLVGPHRVRSGLTRLHGHYQMTLYSPSCDVVGTVDFNPMYFLNLNSFHICKGYGDVGVVFGDPSGSCRDGEAATRWVSKNGLAPGTHTYQVDAEMTDGTTQSAQTNVTLTN